MKMRAHKALKLGYGLGILSLEGAERVAKAVKRELKLNENESRKLAVELVRNSEKASKEVLKAAGKHLEEAIVRSGIVSKGELSRVKKRVVSKVKRELGLKRDNAWQKVKKRVLSKRLWKKKK